MRIVLWLNCNANANDKWAIRDEIHRRFREPGAGHHVDLAALPVWRVAANPTVRGWVLSADETVLQRLGVNLSDVTTVQFDAWKAASLENPNHLQVRRGDDPSTVLRAAGLEPEPEPEGFTP